MTIEIYERATGKVIETKTNVTNLRGFMVYWSLQCDSVHYGYRIKEDAS